MKTFCLHYYPSITYWSRGIPWRANNTDDIAAVERHAAFRIGVFSDAAYITGDWPKIMTDTLPPSYLPRFTAAEKKDLLGTVL